MREIKFRAWDKNSKRLAIVTTLDLEMGGLEYESHPNSKLKFRTIVPMIDCELMQYTGLKDKNGIEIYEGDIVTTGKGESGFPPYDQEQPRLIEFRNGCWCFDAGRYEDGDWIRFGFWTASNEGRNQLKQIEVIGNIYENKELLEATNAKED